MVCDIVKEYGRKCAAKQMVNMIENVTKNLNISIEEAVKALGVSLEEYQNAKQLLAKSQNND